jgi:hypothetical protein
VSIISIREISLENIIYNKTNKSHRPHLTRWRRQRRWTSDCWRSPNSLAASSRRIGSLASASACTSRWTTGARRRRPASVRSWPGCAEPELPWAVWITPAGRRSSAVEFGKKVACFIFLFLVWNYRLAFIYELINFSIFFWNHRLALNYR